MDKGCTTSFPIRQRGPFNGIERDAHAGAAAGGPVPFPSYARRDLAFAEPRLGRAAAVENRPGAGRATAVCDRTDKLKF